MPDPDLPHRRDFVRALTLGASVGLLTGPARIHVRADDPPKPDQEPSEAEPPDPVDAEIDARMQLLLARFGEQLDEEARQEIRQQVGSVVRRGQALRQFPLDNGEGPFPVFIPYRAPLA